jgi:DNA-binding YbaB/EbfC family protein
MFKGLSNLTTLLKEVHQIQGRTEEMQQKLGQLRVDGRAGGEMVTVQADGLQRIVAIKIEPGLLQDAEMLEDLLVAATNQALDKSRELAAEEFSKITQMQLPGLSEMMSKFGLGGGGGTSSTSAGDSNTGGDGSK